jgi:hypothetical protein
VAFIDPRRSQVDVVQAVGRAIRKAEDKTLGTVVIPVFIEEGRDAEEVLSSSEFERVWQIVRALRDHDDELAEEIDELRRELGRRGSVRSSAQLTRCIAWPAEPSASDRPNVVAFSGAVGPRRSSILRAPHGATQGDGATGPRRRTHQRTHQAALPKLIERREMAQVCDGWNQTLRKPNDAFGGAAGHRLKMRLQSRAACAPTSRRRRFRRGLLRAACLGLVSKREARAGAASALRRSDSTPRVRKGGTPRK